MANAFLNTKETLILTAIEVIDELGIQGLTTREVAKRQNMSNAVLFNHFHSKNELILAVLEYFIQYDEGIYQSVSSKDITPTEAIYFMYETVMTYYENYPAITSIIQAADGLMAISELSSDVKRILGDREKHLNQLIKDAQTYNEISLDTDSKLILDIINGTVKKICIDWRTEGYQFSLKEYVLKMLHVVLEKFSCKT